MQLLDCLTRRQRQIAVLVAKGQSNRAIAEVLDLSEQTVKNQLRQAFLGLRIRSRLQLGLSIGPPSGAGSWVRKKSPVRHPTKRQWQVLARIARSPGKKYVEIAGLLGISPSTLKTHLALLGAIRGLHGRKALIKAYRQKKF